MGCRAGLRLKLCMHVNDIERRIITDISLVSEGRYRVSIEVCENGEFVAERKLEVGSPEQPGHSTAAYLLELWLDDARHVGTRGYEWHNWARAEIAPVEIERRRELYRRIMGE